MPTRSAPVLIAALLVIGLAPPVRAETCDGLAARVIRVTGTSIAGRLGPGAVFRAADAERMSLDCRAPARIVIATFAREPRGRFFALAGLAARALAGTEPEAAETLARRLHQDSLLADAPATAALGGAALRCETGPRDDSLAGLHTVCVVERAALRRKAGLSRTAPAG